MEFALNLSWLLLALAALAGWRRRVIGRNVHGRCQALSRLLALVCALAVLFPVISVTDDLHAEQAVMEDSNASRKILKDGSAGDRSAVTLKLLDPPGLLFSAAPHARATVFLGMTPLPAFLSLSLRSHHSLESRAPPLN